MPGDGSRRTGRGAGRPRKPPEDNQVRECKAHCSTCGSHFSSDEAFDLHRRGSFQEERYCEEPEDATHQNRAGRTVRSLDVAQAAGRCTIYGEPRVGVVIWRKARSEVVTRMREAA